MRFLPQTQTGIAAALGSAILFGASTPFAKALLGQVSPWLLAGLLYLGVGLGLGLMRLSAGMFRARHNEAPLRRRDIGWLAAIVVFGGIGGPVFLMIGLTSTSASAASLLLNLEGLATLGIAWIVYRENVDLRIGLGAAAILLGALLLSWQGDTGGMGFGAVAVVAACLCWGIDNNLTRKLSSADPVQIAMIKGLAAGGINLVLAQLSGDVLPDWPIVAQAMVIGVVGYGVSLVLFIYGLRHLGAARTGAYFSLAPFMGAALAILAFGEALSLAFGIAAALMGIGLYLHLAERHEHEHRHEELVHEHAHRHDGHHRHDHALDDPPGEPHVHPHRHAPMIHRHPHFPDIHHRHGH
ncbi:MAG: DMT family transporter [Alphaproteobacteria bacterium]|nr:DMT family transporter [Alphaproteobacteria bacterium]